MKRNQKGFTLIELLAVIVILAIIALIATPMVLKYIEDARVESAERSAEAAIKAAETAYVASLLDSNPENHMTVGTYSVIPTPDNTEDKEIVLDVKNGPTAGTVTFTKGQTGNPDDIVVTANGLVFDTYSCDYDAGATCNPVGDNTTSGDDTTTTDPAE